MPSPDVTDWIRRNAAPLDDLPAFAGALDGVRVVGLGESTHGTAEFFRLKHRLVEHLVTELGYTVFAMEASASAAPAVDAYIRYGTGDAATVLKGLGFWTWRTREVLDLIEWLRVHNAARPEGERVRFVGVDPQRCGASVELVAKVLKDELEPLRVLAEADPGSRPDAERRLVRDAEKVVALLEKRDEPEALRHARILVRAADLVTRRRQHADFHETVFAARDRYMADGVAEILDADPDAKVALWGHNGHIAKARYGNGIESLGTHLRDRYGDAYYALGLVFGEGGFRARRMWPGPWRRVGKVAGNKVGPAPDGTVEAVLKDSETYLVDFRSAAKDPAMSEWLTTPQMTRTYGAVVTRFFYRLNLAPTVLGNEFDGLAYVPVSTPSVPLAA